MESRCTAMEVPSNFLICSEQEHLSQGFLRREHSKSFLDSPIFRSIRTVGSTTATSGINSGEPE
jgi:hypothetical protein